MTTQSSKSAALAVRVLLIVAVAVLTARESTAVEASHMIDDHVAAKLKAAEISNSPRADYAEFWISPLLDDLRNRGLLARTLVVWMGEFGRSPQVTSGGRRNHHSKAWSSLLTGGGIQGGQVIGKTDATATEVVERPVTIGDFLATICNLLGIDHSKENNSPGISRPVRIVEKADSPLV